MPTALLPWLDDPFYILKRELMLDPAVRPVHVSKMKMIPVDRGAKGKVMAKVLERTKRKCNGRQLIIYPEGTRRRRRTAGLQVRHRPALP
jgi:1-acyl-sn-glycerol-3-phosphate acyltransferase